MKSREKSSNKQIDWEQKATSIKTKRTRLNLSKIKRVLLNFDENLVNCDLNKAKFDENPANSIKLRENHLTSSFLRNFSEH